VFEDRIGKSTSPHRTPENGERQNNGFWERVAKGEKIQRMIWSNQPVGDWGVQRKNPVSGASEAKGRKTDGRVG